MKTNCCEVYYEWVIIQNQTVIKIKVVLDLSNYATQQGLDHATDVNAYDLAAEKDFIALQAEVDKLKMSWKLISLNKNKVYDLEVLELKTTSRPEKIKWCNR